MAASTPHYAGSPTLSTGRNTGPSSRQMLCANSWSSPQVPCQNASTECPNPQLSCPSLGCPNTQLPVAIPSGLGHMFMPPPPPPLRTSTTAKHRACWCVNEGDACAQYRQDKPMSPLRWWYFPGHCLRNPDRGGFKVLPNPSRPTHPIRKPFPQGEKKASEIGGWFRVIPRGGIFLPLSNALVLALA